MKEILAGKIMEERDNTIKDNRVMIRTQEDNTLLSFLLSIKTKDKSNIINPTGISLRAFVNLMINHTYHNPRALSYAGISVLLGNYSYFCERFNKNKKKNLIFLSLDHYGLCPIKKLLQYIVVWPVFAVFGTSYAILKHVQP